MSDEAMADVLRLCEEWADDPNGSARAYALADRAAHLLPALSAEVARLRAERDAAREALGRYGQHDGDCFHSGYALAAEESDEDCTCGGWAALSSGGEQDG